MIKLERRRKYTKRETMEVEERGTLEEDRDRYIGNHMDTVLN